MEVQSGISKLVSIRDVCSQTSLSRTLLWRKVRDNQFPKPIRLDPAGNRKAFVLSEVQAWISERIAQRDTEAA